MKSWSRARAGSPPSYWVPFAQAVFVPAADAGRGGGGPGTSEQLLDRVVQRLLGFGVPLVDAPGHILESVERAAHPKRVAVLSPQWVREFLRSACGREEKAALPLKGASGGQGALGDMSPEDAANFLEYAMSDGDVGDLKGVPLVLAADEEVVQAFRTPGPKEPVVFVPQGELERRLFPKSRESRRCVLSSRLEQRPVVWARLKEMAALYDRTAAEERQAPQSAFQCRTVTFALLWEDWVESWLQALWRWLEQKNIPLTQLLHWPVLPSLSGDGVITLHRQSAAEAPPDGPGSTPLGCVPVGAGAAGPAAPPAGAEAPAPAAAASGPAAAAAAGAGAPAEPAGGARREAGEDSQGAPTLQQLDDYLGGAPAPRAPVQQPGPPTPQQRSAATAHEMGKLLQRCLGCVPVWEPAWLLEGHEKALRCCVHAGTPEGMLRAMHVSSRLMASSSKGASPDQRLRSAFGDGAGSLDAQRALVVSVALAQRDGCMCESASGPDWKCRCEVVRALPLFCRFNQQATGVALLDARATPQESTGGPLAGWSVLPDTCPQVVGALREARVELPSCLEVPPPVLQSLTQQEGSLVAALLRELALPRLRWADLLLHRVFPWAMQAADPKACQGLMEVVVKRWREMELSGNERCLEALQRVPFVGTVSGKILSAAQVLDPKVEKLRRLYGGNGTIGPFPEPRFLSAECRQVLRYRTELEYDELNERLVWLHEQEAARRAPAQPPPLRARAPPQPAGSPPAPRVLPGQAAGAAGAAAAPTAPAAAAAAGAPKAADAASSPVAAPAADLAEPVQKGLAPGVATVAEALMHYKPKSRESSLWTDFTSMLAGTIESKLKACFWLPPVPPPLDWPAGAPWFGASCGLCCAAEVRVASEEALVGMPPAAPRGAAAAPEAGQATSATRPPRAFLEAVGLGERPEPELMLQQLERLEAWTGALAAESAEAHGPWLTRCLYDHLYPAVLSGREDGASRIMDHSALRLWVPGACAFVPPERIAKQPIEFPPYLVRAPAEWEKKVPKLWATIKDTFAVQDCTQALTLIQDSLEKASLAQLSAESLELAVRLVMAITDMLQQERSAGVANPRGQVRILMPTSERALRPVEECVFNNMTWLPDVETADLSLGSYRLVHPKISHTVAHTCGCRGLSLVYAAEATDTAGAAWYEAAGQSEPMTTRLKNLLKDYPSDISMFKEMVQNADDAGATKVHFVWDWRQHRSQSLLTPDMDRWQGPALWIFNDACFSERDFESICRLGVGGKREAARKIGRFGLGFNSVYNFTDLPSILSDDVVLFLDPHVHHLSAMGASVQKPGIKLRFLKINVLDKFRDQFEPYHGLLGCNLSKGEKFNGTLVRVPFRTAETAKSSQVSNIALDRQVAEELNAQFRAEAFQWLLFLQSVAEIQLSEIPEHGSPEPRCLAQVQLLADEVTVAANVWTSTPAAPAERKLWRYRLVGGVTCPPGEQVCIAVPLKGPGEGGVQGCQVALRSEDGRLFCFLPLPRSAVSLRLPVHVHAPVNVTQDRRNVLLDDRVGDRDLIQQNVRLLDVRIPECLARCVLDLSGKMSRQELFCLFPTLSAPAAEASSADGAGASEGGAIADRLATAFYRQLIRQQEPIFPLIQGAPGQPKAAGRVSFREAVFFSEREGRGAHGAEGRALVAAVAAPLARFGVPVVELPVRVLESIERVLHPAQPRVLTPAWLRQFLKAMSANADSRSPSFPLRESAEAAAPEAREVSSGAGPAAPPGSVHIDHLTVAEAGALLEFALVDGNTADLEGVPLLVTESLATGTVAFRSSPGAATVFVPEDEEEYDLLPHAPHRVISRELRKGHPWVWQHLRHLVTSSSASLATPLDQATGGGAARSGVQPPGSFQLRRVALEPLLEALQDLLPAKWNAEVPQVLLDEWSTWVEIWLKALWRWLHRMSVPMQRIMHWPLIPSLVQGEGSELVHVNLHKLLPESPLFSAYPARAAAVPPAVGGGAPLLSEPVRKALVAILQKRLGCSPVQEPQWLQAPEHERQLRGFVHPCSPDGFMQAAHVRLKAELRGAGQQAPAGSDPTLRALARLRERLAADLGTQELGALVAWLSLVRQESCCCLTERSAGWKRRCGVVRAAPIFCLFSRPAERVALVDFDARRADLVAGRPSAGEGAGGAAVPAEPATWALMPEACSEVCAAVRAAGVELPTVVEVPPDLAAPSSAGALLKELGLPRLSWAEVLLHHIFPWARSTTDVGARQGLMLAVVRQWRELELAGNDECVEALQHVPFVGTVGGQTLSPAEILDPTAEDLPRLYGSDASPTCGPFPTAELYGQLAQVAQRGLLRFRKELSLQELMERLTFLHKEGASAAGWGGEARWSLARPLAENLLQYVAARVAVRCAAAAERAASEGLVQQPRQADEAAEDRNSRSSFFLWPAAFKFPMAGDAPAAAAPAPPVVNWSEDDVEALKCKVRATAWLPAAPAPREWLPSVPWRGAGQQLWRPDQMRLMPEFWLRGATTPLLCLDTQLGLSGEGKQRARAALLDLLGLPAEPSGPDCAAAAWRQLDAVRSWWSSSAAEGRSDSGASFFVASCLHQHVYPALPCRPAPAELGEEREARRLAELFVGGDFVGVEDISAEQGFREAGLHQLPRELLNAPAVRQVVKRTFSPEDLGRALERLRAPLAADQKPQLVEVAVSLCISLADRVIAGEEPPDAVLVPTQRGTLRPAKECVFNNMKHLSEEEYPSAQPRGLQQRPRLGAPRHLERGGAGAAGAGPQPAGGRRGAGRGAAPEGQAAPRRGEMGKPTGVCCSDLL
ncbi:unnamed protein product [Prorocentrum cordatum]|uniref:Sacsin/Nov domain-containing protein n=1 Tax=Prorocentrum cordatum TaxID=2364126 RepID=A0ABN9VNX7_9DINO|nr:unnamed protein product [Polarella glacialis]